MRILFLAYRDPSNPYLGGGDIYINELAKGCARRGHSVTLISSKFPGSKSYEFVAGINVIRMGNGYTMFAKVFAYYFRYLRGRFDVVVEEIMGGPRIPFFSRLYTKEKIVAILQQRHKEIFQHLFSFPFNSFLSFLERFLVLLYRSKVLVVNSSRTRQDLHKLGFLDSRMHIVYPGLPNWFFAVANTDFSSRYPRAVCLTKIRRYKLIDCAIRAMGNVCKVIPNCELIIAGRTNDVEPKYEEELRRLVEDRGLSKNVSFRKDISEVEKIKLLKTCRALVLPSAIEGFGIVVIEANACGTPAIVTDRIPKDAAIDGYNAIVFPCYDEKSLAHAISSLMLDESMWTKMSINAKNFAEKFAWNESVERFVEVIKNV